MIEEITIYFNDNEPITDEGKKWANELEIEVVEYIRQFKQLPIKGMRIASADIELVSYTPSSKHLFINFDSNTGNRI